MLFEFIRFELKSWAKSPTPYIFFLINFLLVFAACISENVTVGADMGNVNINSPFAIMSYSALMSLISVVMTTAFINKGALKDFTSNFDAILFTTPMKKGAYLLGRFLSSTMMACIPLLGVLLAIVVAPNFAENVEKVGPVYWSAYLQSLLVFILPNTLLISAIIFALAVLFRSTVASFIGAIILLVAYLIAGNFIFILENETVAVLADPFGVGSLAIITKYWTLDEKNTQWLTFFGPILMNRLLWISAAVVIFSISYWRFSFTSKKAKKSKSIAVLSPQLKNQFKILDVLPTVKTSDRSKANWIQVFSQVNSEFWGIIKSPAFIVIALFAAINMLAGISGSDLRYAGGNFPVTYIILEGIEGSFHLFLMVIIAYYSGVLVWRERTAKMNEIMDATPSPSWVPLVSKYISLLAVVAVLLLMAMFLGMGMQAVKGYYHFEPFLYIKQLFLIDWIKFAIMLAVAFFIQVWANNMYLGFAGFVIFLVVNNFVWGALDINSNLLSIGSMPSYKYSDMNQYSLFSKGLFAFNMYWLFFAALTLLASFLFWVRGKGLSFKNRLSIAKQRFQPRIAGVFFALLAIWVGSASFLYYNTEVLNKNLSNHEVEVRDMSYEQKFKKYQGIDQPRIVALDYNIEIYPKQRIFKSKALVTLKNKHDHPIDSIHFTTPLSFDTEIVLEQSKLVFEDLDAKYFIYQLDEAIAAGDSIQLIIFSNFEAQGIENEVSMENINENGTFVENNAFMPSIGYSDHREIEDRHKRKDLGLSERDRMAKLGHTCSASCNNTYISDDSDWISLASTISTDEDQIAIAPGALVKEWSENGRKYFRYEIDQPVLNFYSFLSAKYEVKREQWNDVDLEVYYHAGHEYNVDKMMKSMRSSLAYFSANFLPYPHKQARIIEFPRFSSFAQAFPGTMPYSESMGFIANLKDEGAPDKVFHTVAHEMAHQWWAHQVIGANVQGSTMLSETFAQYSAMAVTEKEYGKDMVQKILTLEMDRYLRSRGEELEAELPLMKVEDQGYIHYRKGSVVMYALKEYLGEEKLNQVLRSFAELTAYQEPPYTTSNVFMSELEAITPDSLQYLINDLFREIVLYDNKAEGATYTKLEDGKYEVTFDVHVSKVKADRSGKEVEVSCNDYLYIGIYGEVDSADQEAKELYYEIHKIQRGESQVKIIVDELPIEAGIDPNYLLIDRIRDDNRVTIEKK